MKSYSATRAHGLEALALLSSSDGTDYVHRRSFDLEAGDNAEVAEPYLRHRLVTDMEAAAAVQAKFASEPKAAFLEDLCAKSFARGWLAHHPGLLQRYVSDLVSLDVELESQPDLNQRLDSASKGQTGIACFDNWAHRVVEGHLHQRSKRAFASIWVFTLKLPWQSGVKFFTRHLLAADLADALLMWREVAGLDGVAPFLVTAEDIATFTGQRFVQTIGLATSATETVPEPPLQVRQTSTGATRANAGPAVLLMTSDDLHPESWPIDDVDVRGVLAVEPSDLYGWYSDQVLSFKLAGLDDGVRRASAFFGCEIERLQHGEGALEAFWIRQGGRDLRGWFEALNVRRLIAMSPAVGPSQDDIAAACQYLSHAQDPPQLQLICREWDHAFEAETGDGRAAFVSRIPDVLAQLGSNQRR